jgi:REP element-mobilizing transposase RayT
MFERSLETTRKRYDLLVHRYVVMPEHVHLPGAPFMQLHRMSGTIAQSAN